MKKRVAALIEVLVAFAFVHVTFRSIKHFSEWGRWEGALGLNFTPGLVMILFTVSALLLCRRNFEAYGLTVKRWQLNLNIGLFWAVLMIALTGLGLTLTHIHFDPAHPHNELTSRMAGAAFGLVVTLLLLLIPRQQTTCAGRVPLAISVLLFLLVLLVPVAVAVYFKRPLPNVLLTVGWLFLGAGFGEETFFRGYIQSRVDDAFGRPFRLLGLDFGLGLCVSSLLFGFLHALNSVDYFQGRFEFAWWYGVQNCFFGLFYGCLRQKTGSILASGVTHGLGDIWADVPRFITGP